jgi:hypothetical protein
VVALGVERIPAVLGWGIAMTGAAWLIVSVARARSRT